MNARRMAIPVALTLSAAGIGSADTVMYVDWTAPADGDGDTWETAYRFLADGLNAATDAGIPIELRVAGGTYVPDRTEAVPLGSGDRFATFRLMTDISVLGGYAGLAGGGDPDVRDPGVFVTILSGDLAGDDVPGFVNIEENSHHVVTASGADGTARLDGLTITGGHANGHVDPVCFGGPAHGVPCETSGDCPDGSCVSLDSTGAGLLAVSGSPWIVNCRVVDNFAYFQGAGMMLKAGSDLIIMDTVFSGNRALDNGGALYLGQSSPVIMRCDFIANSGGRYAGASCNRDHSNAQFIDCVFTDNTAAETTDTGGGAIVNASSSPMFNGCTFNGNHSISGKGGAVYNKRGFHPELGPSRAEIVNCTFDDNEAGLFGGGVYGEEQSETTVHQSTFSDNAADRGGAVYTTGGATTVVTESVLERNHVRELGGAVYNDVGATTTLTGSTLESNTTEVAGGALYDSGTTELITCTVRANTADLRGGGLYNEAGSMTVIGGTVERNRALDYYAGGIYNDFDAVLTVDGVLFEANEASGVGGGIYSPGASTVELGFVTNCTFHANVAGNYGGGLYGAFIVRDTVFMQNVAVTGFGGGYVATNDAQALEVTDCVFDGNIAGDGGGMYAGGGFGKPITIAGCEFRNNYASDRNGGGLLITNSPVTIIDSTFDANTCSARGGGLSISGGSIATIDGCVVIGNSAAGNGGGLRLAGNSTAVITRCDFEANDGMFAGGVYVNDSALAIDGCRIIRNSAAVWGGGLYASHADFEMTNCIVSGNVSPERGGGIHLYRSNPLITSTAIVQNAATDFGGGIYNQVEAYPVVANCILWRNWTSGGGTGEDAQITDQNGSRSSVIYSCVEGWTGALGGEGNIGTDPLFVDQLGPDGMAGTSDDDLSLASGSPCIDAADNEALPVGIVLDFAGRPRFVDDPDTIDTGYGTAPITDMGAFEFQVACPADVDGDGDVGFGDVLRILASWGDPGGPEDVDGNGEVGFGDVLTVLARWGTCP